ncbi:helix-turn-helix transcriptional regulator [Lachnospiraceae bacterium ASD3451]|uniref:helix-turn-helix domain-containing protein n=1 Tax=Diplocloster agilis TaxID=2850323 RepID=UPI001D6B69D8|nr:helix-turn-helix transcriptional regulator [Diplocloster agilis]MBU9745731.1 helix-turn-helix transcriptional regulator [Diplocloster agilis]
MEKAMVLENLIKQRGYNLKSFAEKCNMPYTTLYGIIKKGVGKASVDNIMKICKNLDITIEELNDKTYGTNREPSYEDVELLIARNGKRFSMEQKMELIKLLSEIK